VQEQVSELAARSRSSLIVKDPMLYGPAFEPARDVGFYESSFGKDSVLSASQALGQANNQLDLLRSSEKSGRN